MASRAGLRQPIFEPWGLSAFTFETMSGYEHVADSGQRHTHMEIEMVLAQSGHYVLQFTGRNEYVEEGSLAVYWAGFPHRGSGRYEGDIFHIAQVPIVHVLSWPGTATIVNRLLSGSIFHTEASSTDAPLFARWSSELATSDQKLRAIVELEMQVRLRRCFHDIEQSGHAPSEHTAAATAAGVAAAIRYVLDHFMEHIVVDDVADAVGWDRYHLMHSFHRLCGLTIWEYVTQVRLAEAQRLLTATELSVISICHRAGFSSASRMHEAFRRHCGTSPSQYRKAVRS